MSTMRMGNCGGAKMASSTERVLLGMLGNPPVLVAPPRRPPVELYNGDCMSREEFHRIYERRRRISKLN